ncbi:glycerate kinase [Aeromicrobium sp.]|uniref:glycerate kinase n=1 Tax=Aeromicrobium sp. TaxID=1871063 RepID=UPI002FC6F863
MTRVLLAPDKFKGSLTASEVAGAVSRGLLRARPDLEVVRLPVADGGDGTVEAAVDGGFTRTPVEAVGPTGEAVMTAYARRTDTAVVELAGTCGIERLAGPPAPLNASSRGLGVVMAAAIEAGCKKLVVGIGGSASTDGGAGMLQALGVRLCNAMGDDLPDGGGALIDVASVDTSALDRRLAEVSITIACDVDNPLLGPRGAAEVYGPQKGASPWDVIRLEAGLRHWAGLVTSLTGTDHRDVRGAGAAGGVGFGALALLGATLRPGADLVFEIVGLSAALGSADIVVTGEGSFDEQTLSGKAPARVAAMAREAGLPTYVVCGRSQLTPEQWRSAGVTAVLALDQREPDQQRCFTEAASLLEDVGAELARRLRQRPPSP